MKNIKFRAWDKENKIMFDIARIDIADGSCYSNIFAIDIYDYWNNVELMQYTGLKDKNGIEIYEGDILKCKLHNGKYENYTIVWNEKDACFDALNKDKSNFMLATIWRISEVIGNIYESDI